MHRMLKKEHEYFHYLMYILTRQAEPKFAKGCCEHRDKKMLWEFTDKELEDAIDEELTDLNMYWAEKLRRRLEGKYEG